jgi:exopolysaccharide production protein ExoQ
MALFYLLTLFAFAAACVGALPVRSIQQMDADNRLTAMCLVLVGGWPLVCTFLIAPLLWESPSAAGPLYILLWYLPAGVLSPYIFMRSLFSPQCSVDPASALLLLIFPFSLIFIVVGGFTTADVVKWGLTLALFLFVILRRSIVTLETVAWACRVTLLLVTGAVLAAVLVNSNQVVDICRMDKCGFSDYALTSPFAGNGNVLGLALGLLLAIALSGRGVVQTAALIMSVLALSEAAGSRTAEVGILVTIVLVIGVRLAPNRRSPTLMMGLIVSLVVSLIPAALSFRNEQFTFRGYLWNQAREMIGNAAIFGNGPTAWAVFAKSAIHEANYSPHSAWLDISLSLGVVGVVIIVCSAGLKIYTASPAAREALILYYSGLLAMSTFESVYVPYYLGILPFASILPFAVGPQENRYQSKSVAHRPTVELDIEERQHLRKAREERR